MSKIRGKSFHEKDRIFKLFERFSQKNPHPKTELIYHSPFELLVAVMLSAQATDLSVNRVTPELFKIANSPQALIDLGLERLLNLLKSLNLFRTKAKHLLSMSQSLLENHGGQVPKTREDLEALAGVGRKTANVVLNALYNEPVVAVDTHVFRVAQRLGLANGKTPLAIETQLEKNIPKQFKQHVNHWLVLHGRYICKARNPLCNLCPLEDLCTFKEKSSKHAKKSSL